MSSNFVDLHQTLLMFPFMILQLIRALATMNPILYEQEETFVFCYIFGTTLWEEDEDRAKHNCTAMIHNFSSTSDHSPRFPR
jgi:hypothetical protein